MSLKIDLIYKLIIKYIKSFKIVVKDLTDSNINSLKDDRIYIMPIGWISRKSNISPEKIINLANNFNLGFEILKDFYKADFIKNLKNILGNLGYREILKQSSVKDMIKATIDQESHIERKSQNTQNNIKSNRSINNTSKDYSVNNFIPAYQFLDKTAATAENNSKIKFYDQNLEILKSDLNFGFIKVNNISKFIENALKFVNLEDLINIFHWKRFEEFISEILEEYNYITINNFRFSLKEYKQSPNNLENIILISKKTGKPQKRFEIDIVAYKRDHILLIDAKYWPRMSQHQDISVELSNAALYQKKRSQLFCLESSALNSLFKKQKSNPKFENYMKNLQKLRKIKIYPLIIYVGYGCIKINDYGVPIVNITELPNFIQKFSENRDDFVSFKIKKFNIQTKIN
ncbi:MAG: hypothetical protein ACTSRZ_12330 [Promethearchaeota archaeon]